MNLSVKEKIKIKKLVKGVLNREHINEETLNELATEFNKEFNRDFQEVKDEIDRVLCIYLY